MLGLVLGGGGAKGYAHIGVLRILEEIGVRPDIIVGASMGSLVGGFYAAGFSSSKMEEIASAIDKRKRKWLLKFNLSRRGLISGKNIISFLTPYFGKKKIEDFSVKYAAIATDIENNCEIIIDKGDLIQAVRSSISIPVAFIPNQYAGRVLIDGGFPNPVPITAAQKLGATRIIAVNVWTRIPYGQVPLSVQPPSGKRYNVKQVFEKTFDYIATKLIDHEMLQLKNGMLIEVDTKDIEMYHFEKAKEAISLGYLEAKRQQENIKRIALC